ncbi:MAG: hypothetical protein M3209_15270 [Acidobacteriota bacterium]|nr:hypothetical protein [Acidobacteriota bacterium]
MSKNVNSAFLAFLILAFTLGCNCNLSEWINSAIQTAPPSNSNTAVVTNANRSTIESTTDTVLNPEKTGIAECDEVLAMIEQQTQNDPEQTITERLARQAAKNLIYSQVRDNLSNMNEQNRANLAGTCRQVRDNLNAANQ